MSDEIEVPSDSRRPFFTPAKFAELIGVHPRTVRQWIADDVIASYLFEGSRRIAAADADAYIASCRRGGEAA